jgi:hypothetical protein
MVAIKIHKQFLETFQISQANFSCSISKNKWSTLSVCPLFHSSSIIVNYLEFLPCGSNWCALSFVVYLTSQLVIFIPSFLPANIISVSCCDRLCGLVVRVPGFRFRGPSFDSQLYKIFWEIVGLEQAPLSLVRLTEELLGKSGSGSGLGNQH